MCNSSGASDASRMDVIKFYHNFLLCLDIKFVFWNDGKSVHSGLFSLENRQKNVANPYSSMGCNMLLTSLCYLFCHQNPSFRMIGKHDFSKSSTNAPKIFDAIRKNNSESKHFGTVFAEVSFMYCASLLWAHTAISR